MLALGLLAAVAVAGADGGFQAGKNAYTLRAREQSVYFIPGAHPSASQRPAVLFWPGDRGWAGKAIDMGKTIASWGYDVYGIDTNTYLISFTGGSLLTEDQIIGDVLALSNAVAPNRKVLLAGWSEGAGLATLGATGRVGKSKYVGVVAFGLSDKNVLAWRWKDNLSVLTQSESSEPTFTLKQRLAQISPPPLAVLRSTGDQFVSAAEAKLLMDAALQPKRYVEIEAKNHRFDGNDEGFYRELKGAFEWIQSR